MRLLLLLLPAFKLTESGVDAGEKDEKIDVGPRLRAAEAADADRTDADELDFPIAGRCPGARDAPDTDAAFAVWRELEVGGTDGRSAPIRACAIDAPLVEAARWCL